MRNLLLVLCVSALIFSCGKKETAISVDDFMAKASEMVDQEVQVKGIVDHVCKCCNKNLALKGEGEESYLKVKGGEDAEKLDTLLAGKEIIVTGVVKEKVYDEEYIKKIMEECEKTCGAKKEADTEEDTVVEEGAEVEEMAEGEEVAEEAVETEDVAEVEEGEEAVEEVEGEEVAEAEEGEEKEEGKKKCSHGEEGEMCCHMHKIKHIKEKIKESGEDKIVKYYLELVNHCNYPIQKFHYQNNDVSYFFQ